MKFWGPIKRVIQKTFRKLELVLPRKLQLTSLVISDSELQGKGTIIAFLLPLMKAAAQYLKCQSRDRVCVCVCEREREREKQTIGALSFIFLRKPSDNLDQSFLESYI